MIAYNPLWLNNLLIREQAGQAFHQGSLDKEERDNINNKYQTYFYSPNFFIRIGLFILTTIILLFSFGLFALLFLSSIDKAISGLAIFFAIVSYAALEYMIQSKNHFQSGVDDALLWISACSLLGGISYLTGAGGLANCVIVFVISLYSCLRFGDRVMSVVWFISLLGIFFFACTKTGTAAKAFVPFVLMAVSIAIYFLVKIIKRQTINQLYSGCLQIISISALISFYFSGNYYIVRELSNAMFNLNLAENAPITLGWFFWLFTVVIPCFYLTRGIQKKDIVLIRIGLLLIAAIIFTVRYYYSIASIEVVMTAGGITLVVISYGLTRYLKVPKFGFTSVEIDSSGAKEKLVIESILLAQTFTGESAPSAANKFGGGSFGGGGASGDF
ncbi:MAG: hypothetical protein ABI707_17440 [Ferruginibacter sp.]